MEDYIIPLEIRKRAIEILELPTFEWEVRKGMARRMVWDRIIGQKSYPWWEANRAQILKEMAELESSVERAAPPIPVLNRKVIG